MIIVNLLLLKSANGMLYFANDYICSIESKSLVFAPRQLAPICRTLFHKRAVIDTGKVGVPLIWLRAMFAGVTLFTPTPHPLPFVNRQLVVVHDSYPFQGRGGRIKRWLFRLSLATSRCKVAYINHSDSKRFVESCVSDSRRVFLPNYYPTSPTAERSRRYQGGILTVALVGTDSAKKNYASLFEAVVKRGLQEHIRFVALGQQTAYFGAVCADYPQLEIKLELSDSKTLRSFFDDIDCLVSVARNEGFGRPIAYAISARVPCFLIEDEVFREFYSGLATFAPTVDDIVSCMLLTDNHLAKSLDSANFPPHAIRLAIEQGLAEIKGL